MNFPAQYKSKSTSISKTSRTLSQNYIQTKYIVCSSLESIQTIINDLRRDIDIYYPKLTPSQRVGHEFAKDVSSIIGMLTQQHQDREKDIEATA